MLLIRSRFLLVFALVASLGLLPGCALIFTNSVKIRMEHRPTDPADRKSPRDYFVAFQGKRKADPDCDTDCPFGVVVAPFSLRPPFTIGAAAGLFDVDRREESQDALYCMEIDDVDDPIQPFGSVFWTICARYTGDGTQIFADDSEGQIDPGAAQTFYPGVTEVEFQIEADGTDLFLRGRERGPTIWDELASVPFTSPSGELLGTIGTSRLFKKGLVGFDSLDYVNTPAAGALPPLESFVADLERAIELQVQACAAIEGDSPDGVSATNSLNLSFDFLESAVTSLDQLPESKERQKAGKRILQAEKKLLASIGQIEKLRYDPAIHRIQKGIRRETDALLMIQPRPIDF
jgi:hypothetical protein